MRTDYARHNSTDRAKLQAQGASAFVWLIALAASGFWMLHGGGIVRPLSIFAVCIATLSFLLIRALAEPSQKPPTFGEIATALRYTGYSVILLMLGILFLEYWPVTVSTAFMFAICRSFRDEDAPAYI